MGKSKYHKDQKAFEALVDALGEEHPPVTLSSEYAYFLNENSLQLLIRLARYKFVARMLRPRDRVLEIGCGSGVGALFLAQHAAHVTGIDMDSAELAHARSICRRDNVTFLEGDFFRVAEDQKFDAVLCLDVIEHMDVEDGTRLVAGMADRLTERGMLIVGCPSIYSYPYQSEISQASHVHCYDQTELVELVEQSVHRVLPFSMNDELVHTGFKKLAWYNFVIGTNPKQR